ncbi:glutamate receptor 2-like [Panulirus ornatus]|uniref:glutamate receptor 2-like n=1 Tax=Panulirus ornatus TaxID=150431 RepID=UPI003A8A6B0B
MVFFSFWIGSVLLYYSYTARLTSQLAVVYTAQPFATLTGALTKAGYSVSTRKGTSYVTEMMTARDEGMRLAYHQLTRDPTLLVDTVREGVTLLHSTKRKVLFLLDVNSVNYELQGNCSYMWVGPEYFKEYVHLGYQKDLPFARALSRNIIQAAHFGIVQKLQKKWWGREKQCRGSSATFPQLSLSKTVTAFAVLISGAILALLLLAVEILFASCRTR